MANVAQGGACLAVWFKTKDAKIKAITLPSAFSAMLGITEAAIFGINLRFVKPFIAAPVSYTHLSADLFLAEEDLPQFAAGQWLHICSIALSAEPSRSATFAAMENIKRAGGRVSFDPNIRLDLWQDQNLLHACLDLSLIHI